MQLLEPLTSLHCKSQHNGLVFIAEMHDMTDCTNIYTTHASYVYSTVVSTLHCRVTFVRSFGTSVSLMVAVKLVA